MAGRNGTVVTEFFLTAFSEHPEWGLPLFLVFLSFYLLTLLGNAGMVLLIRVDGRLHTPMYFFLGHLSFVDMCYSSAAVLQLRVMLLERGRAVLHPLRRAVLPLHLLRLHRLLPPGPHGL